MAQATVQLDMITLLRLPPCHTDLKSAETQTAVSVTAVGQRFRRLGKHFMEVSDYDEIPLCRYRYCTLSEVRDYWRSEEDGDAQ